MKAAARGGASVAIADANSKHRRATLLLAAPVRAGVCGGICLPGSQAVTKAVTGGTKNPGRTDAAGAVKYRWGRYEVKDNANMGNFRGFSGNSLYFFLLAVFSR